MYLVLFALIISSFANYLVIAQDTSANDKIGNMLISKSFGEHKLELNTKEQYAGAIYSLKFDDHEMLDAVDHGRELQSASNFDAGSPITDETYNPTEAGSVIDRDFKTTSSKLLHAVCSQDELQTITQMAFWLPPGGKSGNNLAKNRTQLSNHILIKDVKIGFQDWPFVIPYIVTFRLPVNEIHQRGTFEALTGYMPIEFDQFIKYDIKQKRFETLNHISGEQDSPLIFATIDGKYAMGCYAPHSMNQEHPLASYGRFMFREQSVTKWNIVFRYHADHGIKPGAYNFKMFVIVNDLETVKHTIQQLSRQIP